MALPNIVKIIFLRNGAQSRLQEQSLHTRTGRIGIFMIFYSTSIFLLEKKGQFCRI